MCRCNDVAARLRHEGRHDSRIDSRIDVKPWFHERMVRPRRDTVNFGKLGAEGVENSRLFLLDRLKVAGSLCTVGVRASGKCCSEIGICGAVG